MTDVYIVTLSIIGFLITSPGLAAAINLFFPRVVETAYMRINQTPVKAFLFGLPVTVIMGAVAAILNSAGGPGQGLAFIIALVWMGLLTVGTSAMARLLGERLSGMTHGGSPMTNIIRGAVIYELAALVPLVGWFLFIPIMSQVAVGAALFGLVRWSPKALSSGIHSEGVSAAAG